MPFTLQDEDCEFDTHLDQCVIPSGLSSKATFCAGVPPGSGLTCEGDSGGSLTVENLIGDKYLVGIFSKRTNSSCAFHSCGNLGNGDEFMNISSYLEGHYQHFSKISDASTRKTTAVSTFGVLTLVILMITP